MIQMGTNRKSWILIICAAILVLCFLGTASAAVWMVEEGESIQDAVDAAGDGDTINVRYGTYTENIKVYKCLTIQSENGPDSTVVQAASSNDHVFEVTADYVTINGFTIKGAIAGWPCTGMYVTEADYCDISNNIVSDNLYGIRLVESSNNALSNNTITNNRYGIFLYHSNNNTLSSNTAKSNIETGISLDYSSDNTLTDNAMSDNSRNFGVSGPELSHFTHNIGTANTVDERSVQYLVDKKDLIIDSSWDVGYLGIVNCTNITVKDLTLSNNGQGVLLAYSNDLRIKNVNTSNISDGIKLIRSSSNILNDNVALKNECGIDLRSSSNNTLTNNCASNNWAGIYLGGSSNNTLTDNTISNSSRGIQLCSGYIGDSHNNILTNNSVFNNRYGFVLFSSTHNTLTNNNILNNGQGDIAGYGIWLSPGASNNAIYLNNFIDNKDNVDASDSSTNIWNSTERVTYTYNSSSYTNYLGNYWSNYEGTDANGDGIGDTPYEDINGDKDNYPLMVSWENYKIGVVSCPAKNAVYQAAVPDPEGILNPLRALRDDNLKVEYVDRYYENSPALTMVMRKDPALVHEAARLIARYSPMVCDHVNGIDVDKPITQGDAEEIVSFTDRLKRDVLENRGEIGATKSQEIIRFLDEFTNQVEASEGKTFSQALRGSIYYEGELMPDPVIEKKWVELVKGNRYSFATSLTVYALFNHFSTL